MTDDKYSNSSGGSIFSSDELVCAELEQAREWQRLLATKMDECEQLQQTLSALTVALGDLNDELRVKANECDALQEIVLTLSAALTESDQQLQHAALRCEQLDFKLQAVSFVEREESASMARRRESEEPPEYNEKSIKEMTTRSKRKATERKVSNKDHLKPRKKEKKSGSMENGDGEPAASGVDNNKASDKDDTVLEVKDNAEEAQEGEEEAEDVEEGEEEAEDIQDGEEEAIVIMGGKEEAVVMQEGEEEADDTKDDSSSSETNSQSGPTAQASSDADTTQGPRQAAFYRVIYERDLARREAERLALEVRHRREQVRSLKDKLDKSTALVELSYQSDERSKKTNDNDKKNNNRLLAMKWLGMGQKAGLKRSHELTTELRKDLDLVNMRSLSDADKAAGVKPHVKMFFSEHALVEL